MVRKPQAPRKKVNSGTVKPRTTGTKRTQAAKKQFADKVATHAASIDTAEDKLTEAVRAGVVRALREPGSVASQWFDTAVEKTKEAMTAVRSAGGDVLTSARSITRGVALGVSDVGGDTVAGAGHVVRAAIDSAVEAGSEAAVVGRRALQGVVDAAQTGGTDTAATAREAVGAVSDTVLSAGQSATELADRLIKTATTRQKHVPAKSAESGAKPAAKKTVKKAVGTAGPKTPTSKSAQGKAKTAQKRAARPARKRAK